MNQRAAEQPWDTLRRIARDIRHRGGYGWLTQTMDLERIADEQEAKADEDDDGPLRTDLHRVNSHPLGGRS